MDNKNKEKIGKMKRFLSILFLFFCPVFLSAQTQITLQSDRSVVGLGENFQLQFSIENGEGGSHDFVPPADFYVRSGPFKSAQSSYSWINGQSKNTQTTTITYVLSPKKKGTFEIPPYTYKDKNGQVFQSEALVILVNEGTALEENFTP